MENSENQRGASEDGERHTRQSPRNEMRVKDTSGRHVILGKEKQSLVVNNSIIVK